METKLSGHGSGHQASEITINGGSVEIRDATPTGAQILAEGGFEPVDEHVLIMMAHIGSRLISLDEVVHLHREKVPRFHAFRTGEVYAFTVNGHGFQWGARVITEPELREMARVPEEDVLILERGDEEPRILGPGDCVELVRSGVEHLRTEKRLVTVFFNNEEKRIPRGVYTTEELMTTFGVEPGYLLNLAEDDGLITLKPHQRLLVRDGMRFFSQAPGGGSS